MRGSGGTTVLGPIFLAAIGEDWTAHLKTMCDFWSSVMNTSGRYKGKPIPAHVKLPGIEPRHFEHWLRLFSETVHSAVRPRSSPPCSCSAPSGSRRA